MADWGKIRPDHRVILENIEPHSTVLDLGCGSGDLLDLLVKEKKVKGQGIEIDDKAIYECITKGLSIHHGDIDSGLSEYRDKAFDYVILNQSLQQVKNVEEVITDSLRVGRKVIVGIPNFAYYKARVQLGLFGRSPETSSLPYKWYETPNLRFLTLKDFIDFCKSKKIHIEKVQYVGEKRRVRFLPNLIANVGIFTISDKS